MGHEVRKAMATGDDTGKKGTKEKKGTRDGEETPKNDPRNGEETPKDDSKDGEETPKDEKIVRATKDGEDDIPKGQQNVKVRKEKKKGASDDETPLV